MDLVRKWMSGAVMTNNSMEDVASKFGNNWGRLAAVIVTLAQPCEIPQGWASLSDLPSRKIKPPIQPSLNQFENLLPRPCISVRPCQESSITKKSPPNPPPHNICLWVPLDIFRPSVPRVTV